MKQLLVLLLAACVSCTGQQNKGHENNIANDNTSKVVTVPLNGTAKWKADEATKNNVKALMLVVSDSLYADAGKRDQLHTDLMAKIDMLINECSMKGADHEALHVWLEKVLEDLKELEKQDVQYSKTYTMLKEDIAAFYQSFE